MATYAENLTTTRNQIAANLVEITANPKPSYSIDGQQVDWQSLFDSYMNQLAKIDLLLQSDDPAEVISYGI
jgi:hypothetical protein